MVGHAAHTDAKCSKAPSFLPPNIAHKHTTPDQGVTPPPPHTHTGPTHVHTHAHTKTPMQQAAAIDNSLQCIGAERSESTGSSEVHKHYHTPVC